VRESKQFDFVPRLWAIRKVGYLLEEIRLRGERAELKDEIVALGKKYGIVTPYTSYLVVEDTPVQVSRPGDRDRRPPPPPSPMPLPWASRSAEAEGAPRGSGGTFAPARPAAKSLGAAPAAEPMPADDFGTLGRAEVMKKADGKEGIAASQAVRKMKDEEVATRVSEPVRQASGRTFIYRAGGWIDSEALGGTSKQLKVKYLSDAYFAILKARPELKAALALSDRLVIVVAKDKSIVIDPDGGETKADAVTAFLK
jgi:Ca-activated chloride channel family protein